MMHDALSVTIRMSTEGQQIPDRVCAQAVDLLVPGVYGYQFRPLTELKIRTTTLTGESQIADQSNPLLTIGGKVAKIRHKTPTHISYYIEET